MKAMHKNEKGFTLVELMVVVVIIGVLVAIAVPLYGAMTTRAANNAHDANVRTIKGSGSMYLANEGTPESDLSITVELDPFLEGGLDSLVVPPASDAYNDDGDTTQGYSVTITANGEVNVIPDYVGAPGSN